MVDTPVERIMSSRSFFVLGSTFHGIEPNVKHEMQPILGPELAPARPKRVQ